MNKQKAGYLLKTMTCLNCGPMQTISPGDMLVSF